MSRCGECDSNVELAGGDGPPRWPAERTNRPPGPCRLWTGSRNITIFRIMTETTFTKAAPDPGHTWIHVVNGALLLAHWAFAIGAYGGLPELVPGHVGSGGVTRWDPKGSSPWFILPIISTVGVMMIYGMSAVASSTPAGVRTPSRKRRVTLPPEGKRYAEAPMRLFLYAVATWTLLLLVYNQYEMYRIAHAGPEVEVAVDNLLMVSGLMLAGVIATFICLSLSVKRRMGEWETMQDSGESEG